MAIDKNGITFDRQELLNRIMQSDLHGRKIYLLGSAEFGPTNEPMLIKSTVGLYNKFGKVGSLIDAFHSIKYTCENNQVYCVKTTGEHSVAYLNVNIANGELIPDGFILNSSESNEIFNEIVIWIDVDYLEFEFPKSLGIANKKYYYKDYNTIDELSSAINKDTKNGKSYVYAYYNVSSDTPVQTAFYACNSAKNYMYGGQCGLYYSKNLLYNYLERTYEMLESSNIDIIVPVDAFMDDIMPNDDSATGYNMTYYQASRDYLTENVLGVKLSFMNQLINFCTKQLNFGMLTIGVIGYNSSAKYWSRYLAEADDIVYMYKACFEYNLKQCDNPFYSFLVSVVGGDIQYNKGTITDSAYLAYAAFCAETIYTSSTTNTPLSDTISIYHEFSEDKLKLLAQSGIIAFRHSPLYEKPVVYAGVTAHTETQNLAMYVNVRMVQLCMSYLNELIQEYIGQDMISVVSKSTLHQDIGVILDSLRSRDIITAYEYNLVPSYSQGKISIYLSLLSNYMVEAIQLCSIIDVQFREEDD